MLHGTAPLFSLQRSRVALCRNHHWAFDNGFFDITEDRTVEVHDDRFESSFRKKKLTIKDN